MWIISGISIKLLFHNQLNLLQSVQVRVLAAKNTERIQSDSTVVMVMYHLLLSDYHYYYNMTINANLPQEELVSLACFAWLASTCVVVVVDGHRGRVVVAQHCFGRGAGIQRGGADLRIPDHARVTEVDVEILVLLEDVVVDHSDCDLWRKSAQIGSRHHKVNMESLFCWSQQKELPVRDLLDAQPQ